MTVEQTPISLEPLAADRRSLRVLLVTTWDEPCGIAEHSAMLKEAAEAADDRIEIVPSSAALDPKMVFGSWLGDRGPTTPQYDLLHLNYQAALHSRWTPEAIWQVRQEGVPVLLTYHDTGVPNSEQCLKVVAVASAVVVHEPFDDLPEDKTYYWRMGVPELPTSRPVVPYPLDWDQRPYLGTVGFPSGWKCYDELCRATEEVGWGILLLAPTATAEDVARWTRLNPAARVITTFLPRHAVINHLQTCDATAFTYVTHNTGQSGAILQGIAARKPVIALSTCRQMRALYADPQGSRSIRWCTDFVEVRGILQTLYLSRLDTGIVALAHQERWSLLGRKYAALYRQLTEVR